MPYTVDYINKFANKNKNALIGNDLSIFINNCKSYDFEISGIGQKAIKIQHFFTYSEISDAAFLSKRCSFEFMIEQLIINPNSDDIFHIDDSSKLREIALENKINLKRNYFDVSIGNKTYGFKVGGVGYKSVKIEFYIFYEDIVNELNSNNYNTLEFSVMEELLKVNESNFEIK